ncbi:hypothetical protein M3650_04070 [Paenibacillus sp. MER TA 81-3]|uniref:hypothetical protein n=1 Tax=Paenibacillus sp. MER TA 81-3 TaxID=2939573 RepID=UPI00203BACEB|nr:hypothetical protein [Paenibacillus sp. MER TA 81-3]MCM3337831.1 hypothetical protein [Paenibacillus sp. MER TA 81-3]
MKKLQLSIFIIFLVNIALIYAVDLMTLKLSPNKLLSGNGNPALILIGLEILAFLSLVISLFFIKSQQLEQLSKKKGIYIILIIIFMFCGYMAYAKATGIFMSLSERLEWGEYALLNIYTNTAFVNYYTLLMGVIICIVIKLLLMKFISVNKVGNKQR